MKIYFGGKNKLKILKIIVNPRWTFKRIMEKYYAIRRYNKLHNSTLISFINKTTNNNIDEYENIVKEYIDFTDVHEFVNKQYIDTNIPIRYPPDPYGWPSFLYYFIRKTTPKIIIETGCFYGNSSVAILSALYKNKYGSLYTIDLPAYKEIGGYYDSNPYLRENERTEYLPDGKEPGFIIPEFLKNRWKLLIGKSSERLPELLNEIKFIDVFLHDSLHSYANMIFEFELAYKYLNKGSFIFSDNIDWNRAFYEFGKDKNYFTYLAYYEHWKLKHNFGAIKKE